MTDLELTTATAVAMGYRVLYDKSIAGTVYLDVEEASGSRKTMLWSPLVSDEQAMALLKKFGLNIDGVEPPAIDYWSVYTHEGIPPETVAHNSNLNRAIVECVANMKPGGAAPSRKIEGE